METVDRSGESRGSLILGEKGRPLSQRIPGAVQFFFPFFGEVCLHISLKTLSADAKGVKSQVRC